MRDLKNRLLWYETRDHLLGQNGKSFNVEKALELARICNYPDATWLLDLFKDEPFPIGRYSFQDLLKSKFAVGGGVGDLAYIYHAGLCNPEGWLFYHTEVEDVVARTNHPYGQSLLARHYRNSPDQIRMARLAADQGEREGFYILGFALANPKEQICNLEGALNLNHGLAALLLGRLHQLSSDKQFTFMERAAEIGFIEGITETYSLVYQYCAEARLYSEHAFKYGGYMKARDCKYDLIEGTHTKGLNRSDRVLIVAKMIKFHDDTTKLAKKSITRILMCLRRIYPHFVCKDIRMVIARDLWKNRSAWATKIHMP